MLLSGGLNNMHKILSNKIELIAEILLFNCESTWEEVKSSLEKMSIVALQDHLFYDLTEGTMYTYTYTGELA
jgi:hypothetical protein